MGAMAPTRTDRLASLEACARACDGDLAVSLRVEALRAIVTLGPAPRVAAVGRRGAGKSALLNALANAPLARTGDVADTTLRSRVWPLAGDLGPFVWLDAPGFRAGGRAGRRDEVTAAVASFGATVIAHCVAATEVDAAIDDDLDDLAAVRAVTPAPVVAIVTRVDELEPPDVTLPPFDDPDKQCHITAACATLARHLAGRGVTAPVVPACALAAWRDGALTYDARWNLPTLAEALRGPPWRDLDGLVGGLLERVIAHHAARAAADAQRGTARAGALAEANAKALLDTLDGLLRSWFDYAGEALRAVHGRAVRRGGALRFALDALGATQAGGALEAARIRSLGAEALRGALGDRRTVAPESADDPG